MTADVDEDDEIGAVAVAVGGGGGGGATGGGPSTVVDSFIVEVEVFVGVEFGVDVVERRWGSARRYFKKLNLLFKTKNLETYILFNRLSKNNLFVCLLLFFYVF